MSGLDLGDPVTQLERMPVAPGVTVADWGCGTGRVTIPLAMRVGPQGSVVAVDIQPLALESVRTKAAAKSLGNIETILPESYPTPLAPDSVDLVVLLDTFHEVAHRPSLLQEIFRILSVGGFLFMDPGHVNEDAARRVVADSGLFRLEQSWSKDMLFRKAGIQ